jgi:hypothetical protein
MTGRSVIKGGEMSRSLTASGEAGALKKAFS